MDQNNQQEVQERVTKLLEKVQGLPTLPKMLQQLNKMMLNKNTSPKEIAQLISSDPAITSRILRVANSSFYGFPNRITTITHATVMLGFNTVKSIVLSSSIFEVFKKGDQSRFDRIEFWKHSIGVGAAAKVLGKRLGFPTTEELFIAGLLHDVGKIVLDQHLHEEFDKVLLKVDETNCLIVEAEEEILSLTHADIGAHLLEKWQLAAGLIECIRYHHNPALASENMKAAAIIHFADILTRALRFGSGGDRRIPAVSESAWTELGFDAGQLDSMLEETGKEIENAMVFLDFI